MTREATVGMGNVDHGGLRPWKELWTSLGGDSLKNIE